MQDRLQYTAPLSLARSAIMQRDFNTPASFMAISIDHWRFRHNRPMFALTYFLAPSDSKTTVTLPHDGDRCDFFLAIRSLTDTVPGVTAV